MIIIIIIFIVFSILYITRSKIELLKSHKLYKRLDENENIQIFDNKGLIAIIYKKKPVKLLRQLSINKINEIKTISENYENEIIILKNKKYASD